MVDPIAPAAPARVLRPSRARCRVVTGTPRVGFRPSIPVIYPAGHDDVLLIVEAVTERPLAEVRGCTISDPKWTLMGAASLDFACSTWHPAMDHLVAPGSVIDGAGAMQLVGREFQFYRDGVLRMGGPLVSADWRLDGRVSFSCYDLAWYLFRKFFGAAERKDYLRGAGSMDRAGLPGWTMTGDATKARNTVDKVRGAGSMLLQGTGTAQIQFSIGARPVVPPVELTAMVKIPDDTPPGTGIMTITTRTATGELIDSRTVTTDEQTQLGRWLRFDTYARLRAGVTNRVTVSLWSPGTWGGTKFDDVRSMENNTTGIPAPGADLAAHCVAGVRHIEQGRGQAPGFGIVPVVEANSGTVEVMGERHQDHQQFQDFLASKTGREDGVDWYIDYLTRQIRFTNRVGIDHEQLVLHDRLVSSGGVTHDESELSSKVVVPGKGDGVGRPEGGYTDTSRTAGLVLDWFHQPSDNTPLSALDPMARRVWEEKSQPQQSFSGMTIPEEYLGIVGPGDTLPADVRSGKFRLPVGHRQRLGAVALDRDAGQLVLT